jgi:NADH-quinone oxidoreductase subunit A
MLEQLLPVLILLALVIVFGGGLLFLTSLAGPKVKKSAAKLMPYECGIPGEDTQTTKIPVKFYLTAISFILFDIEVIFLYPWALIYPDRVKEFGGYMLLTMGLFMGVLIFGLWYEWKAKALEWD